jgi:hypothetical protein
MALYHYRDLAHLAERLVNSYTIHKYSPGVNTLEQFKKQYILVSILLSDMYKDVNKIDTTKRLS